MSKIETIRNHKDSEIENNELQWRKFDRVEFVINDFSRTFALSDNKNRPTPLNDFVHFDSIAENSYYIKALTTLELNGWVKQYRDCISKNKITNTLNQMQNTITDLTDRLNQLEARFGIGNPPVELPTSDSNKYVAQKHTKELINLNIADLRANVLTQDNSKSNVNENIKP